MDGVSPSAGVRGCRFRVVALATVAGLIGGGGAVRLGCLMQTEGIRSHTHTHKIRISKMQMHHTLRGKNLSRSVALIIETLLHL